jgi:hypothetical protein
MTSIRQSTLRSASTHTLKLSMQTSPSFKTQTNPVGRKSLTRCFSGSPSFSFFRGKTNREERENAPGLQLPPRILPRLYRPTERFSILAFLYILSGQCQLHASHYESLARTDWITSRSPTSLGARLSQPLISDLRMARFASRLACSASALRRRGHLKLCTTRRFRK